MARRVRFAALGLVCALLALGAAWVLLPDDRPAEAPSAPLSGSEAASAGPRPPDQLVDAPPEARDRSAETARSLPSPTPADTTDEPSTPSPSPRAAPAPTPHRETRGIVVDKKGNPIGGAELTPARVRRSRAEVRAASENLRWLLGRKRRRKAKRRRHALGRKWRTTSGSDGSFVLPEVPASGLLQVKAAGFLTTRIPLDAPRSRLRIVLRRSRRHLGTVVSAENYAPLYKARIDAKSTNYTKRTISDPMGRFTLHPPADETLWILVSAKERVSKVWQETDHPTIELARGRPVSGTAFRASRSGLVPGGLCRIVVMGANQKAAPPQSLKANTDGTFRLEGGIDPQEEFTAYAFDHRYAMPLGLKWHPPGRDNLRLVMVERGGARLSNGPNHGTLRPVTAEGIPGLDPNPWTMTRPSSRDGAEWSRLAAGKYQLLHDGARVGLTFEVRPGRVTYIRWKDRSSKPNATPAGKRSKRDKDAKPDTPPETPRTLNVRVLDGSGRPVIGATVTAEHADRSVDAKTGEGGRVRLALDHHDWTIRAAKTGLFLERPAATKTHTGSVVTLRLVPPITLRGRLQPTGAASLKLLQGGKVIATGTAKADGTFALPGLAPGAYRLQIERKGAASTVDVTVPGPELVVKLE